MIVINDGNEVQLYGRIYEGDGPYVVSQLKRAFDTRKGAIVVGVHTPGGSVLDGNLIYNFLKNSTREIETRNLGLAASMGTIIMMAGDRITMAENAFWMIHAPSGHGSGTAKALRSTANVLDEMQENFISKYTQKTKKKRKEVEKWMDGDNWFSAKQAVSAGLVDQVVGETYDTSDIEASGSYNLEALSTLFSNDLYDSTQEPLTSKTITKKDKAMTKILSSANIAALGLTDEPSEKEINAAVKKLISEKDAETVRADQAEAQVENLQSAVDQAKEAEIEAMINAGVKDGRIPADKTEHYRKLAAVDLNSTKEVIASLPAAQRLPRANASQGGSAAGRESWTAKDWQQKDMKGFLQMKSENPEKYRELLGENAQFLD